MLYLPCPKCNGELQVRVAKRGPKAGFEFYGCDNFPLCKFTAEKTNVVDLVKKEIFKKQIPTQDSKFWIKEHLSKLSKKEIRFLASINDVPFNKQDDTNNIVDELLSLNDFELFELNFSKWCFLYEIRSDFFSGFSITHQSTSKIFSDKTKRYKVLDNKFEIGGEFKITKTKITLSFLDDYKVKNESGNSVMLILDQDKSTAMAQIVNPQVINEENFKDFLLSI